MIVRKAISAEHAESRGSFASDLLERGSRSALRSEVECPAEHTSQSITLRHRLCRAARRHDLDSGTAPKVAEAETDTRME